MLICARTAWALVYEVFKMTTQIRNVVNPRKNFFKTLKDGASEKRKRIQTKRLWVDGLCINRKATRRKNKQSNVNETVNDGYLAMGEKISEFQVGIEPMTSETQLGCSNHGASRTPSLTSFIHGCIQRHSIFHANETVFSPSILREKKKRKMTVFFSLHQGQVSHQNAH